MNEQKNNGSKLFLTELMISIFFFTVVVAICIQLFSEAHTRSARSKELTEALNICSNAADYYIHWDSDKRDWENVFGGKWQEDRYTKLMDADFDEVKKNEKYIFSVELESIDGIETANISVLKSDDMEEVYSLKVERLKHEKEE